MSTHIGKQVVSPG